MIIEESDFKLEQIDPTSNFWDLTFVKVINKGKINERTEFKDPLYGLTLDSAIRRIASFRMNSKHPEDAIPLGQYLKEYRELIKQIITLCYEHQNGPDKN